MSRRFGRGSEGSKASIPTQYNSRASEWGLGDRRAEKAIEEDVAQIVYALSTSIANTSEYLRSLKSTLLVRSIYLTCEVNLPYL